MTPYREKVYAVNAVVEIYENAMDATAITLPDMPRKPLPESEKKVPVAARVDPAVFNVFVELARDDDRTISYMVEKAMREFADRRSKPPRRPPAR